MNHHDHWCRIGFRIKVSSAVSFDTAVAYNWLGNTVEANIVSSPYKIRQTPWKWPLTWSVYGERAKMRHSTWFTPWPLIVNSEPQLNTTSESSSILGRHKSPFWFRPIFPLQIVPAGPNCVVSKHGHSLWARATDFQYDWGLSFVHAARTLVLVSFRNCWTNLDWFQCLYALGNHLVGRSSDHQ